METPTTTIEVNHGLAQREGLASRVLDVLEVTRETERAFQLRVCATVRESDRCHHCGRAIDNPVSRLAGYGPYCSDDLGIPRDFTDEDIAAIREAVKVKTETTIWLPKRSITVLDGPALAGPPRDDEPQNIDARIEKNRIAVRAPFKCKDALKSIPGARWNPQGKAWTFPPAPRVAAELATLAAGHGLHLAADREVAALVVEYDDEVNAQAHKTADDLPPVPCSATDAWNHQRQAFWFTQPLRGAMLAMDMGTGKSKVAVDLVVNRDHHRTLIACPKAVVGVWPKQFALHAGKPVTVLAPRTGPKGGPLTVAKRAQAILDGITVDGPAVVVVNIDSVWRPEMAKVLSAIKWDCVIVDESHKIKAPGGKASRFLAELGKRAAYRLALTGTPMPHSPLDLYAQYRFIDPSIFGTSFTRFRSEFAIMGGWQDKQVVGYRNQAELARRMYQVAFRVESDDVLDLPPTQDVDLTFQLSPKAQRVANALAGQFYAELENGTLTTDNKLVEILRQMQVTSGRVPLDPDDDGNVVYEQVDTGKRDTLADDLDDLPVREPVVVFARFTEDLANVRAVCEDQGRRYGELSGRDHSGLTADSTMRDDIDVLGVQIQSGGAGVDLTRAAYAYFYSIGHSLGDYLQARARLARPGQTRPVRFRHLVAENSIDVTTYAAAQAKEDIVNAVMQLGR